MNKSGQCSKSIFSYTVRGFDPIPRLRARPKCEFENSTEILCYFLCYFLKTPEFGRSPEFREPATALRAGGQVRRSVQGVSRPSESMQINPEANFTALGHQNKTMPVGQDEAWASYLEMTD